MAGMEYVLRISNMEEKKYSMLLPHHRMNSPVQDYHKKACNIAMTDCGSSMRFLCQQEDRQIFHFQSRSTRLYQNHIHFRQHLPVHYSRLRFVLTWRRVWFWRWTGPEDLCPVWRTGGWNLLGLAWYECQIFHHQDVATYWNISRQKTVCFFLSFG